MYKKFYGFRDRPFEITPDPKFVYLSENHQEALAHLQYAVQEGKGFSVIIGEAGTGKTTLVHMLLSKLDGHVRTSYIFNPVLDRGDFLNYICDDLGIKSDGMKSRGQSLAALHNFLLECFARDEKVFLIIDEAQSMEPELLQEVRLLTNLETSKQKLLHVILLGQPELSRILAEPRFRPLKQRITIRYHLKPLSLKETKAYIEHRLKRARARNIHIFDNSAIKEIYQYSNGIPRLINIVCDNALLTGFSMEQGRIGKGIIEDVEAVLEGSKKRRTGKTLWLLLVMFLLIVVLAFIYQESILKLWR
ncbi:MAG: AAA family ATPase [Syntrophaceae bacterium]|nr:AAA family ATPase [Syntrophaceae bacterium]